MKNFMFVFLAFASISLIFSSCAKENLSSDELLANEIAASNAKIAIEPENLPQSVKTDVAEKHPINYIFAAALVEQKGYELILGDTKKLYFDIDGKALATDKDDCKDKKCDYDKDCDYGKPMKTDDLPADVITYLSDNHAGENLAAAFYIDDATYLVVFEDKSFVVVEDNGTFMKDGELLYGCDKMGSEVKLQDLPAAVTDAITAAYPNADMKVAFLKDGDYVVGLWDNGDKLVVIYTADGQLLVERK